MYERKSLKLISLLLTLCFLLTAFSGSAIRAQAEELGINNTITASSSNDLEQWALINLYDTETFANNIGYIDTAISFADTLYRDLMSISICRYGNISVDTVTELSDCPAGVDLPCREALGCGTALAHHKDIGCVMDDLGDWYEIGEFSFLPYYKEIVVLWTHFDGVYCEYIYGQHYYPRYCAVTRATECTTTIMDPMASNANGYTAHLSFLLAHELVHHMGFADAYGSGKHINNDEYACLMDYFDAPQLSSSDVIILYQRWLNHPEEAFCDDCKETMGIS